MPKEKDLVTSSIGRFFKVSGLVSKVGYSLVGDKVLNIFLGKDSAQKRKIDTWVKNGQRIFETLGNLKGGIMKVGQMLSIQEGLLPPEFIKIIRNLQKNAPPIQFKRIRQVLEKSIPDYQSKFREIDPTPFATASIGQVHRAELFSGEQVILKIQFPDIDTIIKSDLDNLKFLFKILSSTVFKMDIDPIWKEIKNNLLEELDYSLEARTQLEYHEFFKGHDFLIVPKPLVDLSTRHVLVSNFESGLSIDEIELYDQEQKNQWAQSLVKLYAMQIFQMGKIHTDPHPGNYNFLSGGRIILYDFGSAKKMPVFLVKAYKAGVKAYRANRLTEEITPILLNAQISYRDGRPLEQEKIQTYLDLFLPVFTERFHFSKKDPFVKKLVELGKQNWSLSIDVVFPADIVLIDRSYAGLLGNLTTLNASAEWGKIFTESLQSISK